MPSFVQDIDVTSPLIQYSGPWHVGGADGDPEVTSYDQHTFLWCTGVKCSAAFSFTGSEVHVIGAHRTSSGPFQAVLDDVAYGPFHAPGGSEQFKIDLFNQTGIGSGQHTLKISNVTPDDPSKPDLNLDHILWTTSINSLTDLKVQDNDALFSYNPPDSWSTDLTAVNLVDFDAGTGHFTSQTGATANLTFVQGGLYTAQLDDSPVSTFSAEGNMLNSSYLAGQMLFYASNLSAGAHTLKMGALPASTVQLFSIDYAIVDGTLNSPSSPPASSSYKSVSSAAVRTSTPARGPTLISPGALGAIITAAAIVVAGLVGGGIYLCCRRRQRAGQRNQQIDVFRATTSTQGASIVAYSVERTPMYMYPVDATAPQ
ncbi:hypothetical protein C8R47DRAFT_1209365 [Mycena vitilis]|nr:hypothetical protein C8R47DRAFT_1209365 [Mycena vitilis]